MFCFLFFILGGEFLGSYNKRVVISGNQIEVYRYENDVIYGYKDKKKSSRGRQAIASDEDKEKNREKVFKRARTELRRLINSNVEDDSKFLTLTFKDNVIDLDYANNEFKKFIKRLNYHFNIKVKYSCVIEFQKRGAIHYHVILYNLSGRVDLHKLSDVWGHGFIKLNKIKGVDNVGAYICKYMTKTDDKRLEGRKMYFNSRSLNKPIEIKEPELVRAVESSLQNQVPKYENSFSNEYNSISYSQYIINSVVECQGGNFLSPRISDSQRFRVNGGLSKL